MAQSIFTRDTGRTLAITRYDAGAAKKIIIRDTSELKEKIDLSRYQDEINVTPTRLVVVEQFPKAGEEVPKGTPVSLTFMSKDSIQVKDIAGLSDPFKIKYKGKSIKKVTDDIQAEEEMKIILDADKKYTDMTSVEKEAVKKYAVEKGFIEAEPDEAVAGAIYTDLSFIYSI